MSMMHRIELTWNDCFEMLRVVSKRRKHSILERDYIRDELVGMFLQHFGYTDENKKTERLHHILCGIFENVISGVWHRKARYDKLVREFTHWIILD